MKIKTNNPFDIVKYFRQVKEKLAENLSTMTLEEQKEYLLKSGKEKSNLLNAFSSS
jgi:hypothetical protein